MSTWQAYLRGTAIDQVFPCVSVGDIGREQVECVCRGLLREFVTCTGISAHSSSDDCAIPSARGRIAFTLRLTGRLVEVNLRRIRCGRAGNFLATALPDGATRTIPIVNFVTRLSATSFGSIGVRPRIRYTCSNNSVILGRTRGVVLSPGRFPHLQGCVKRAIVAASNAALLNTSSGTNVTSVIATYRRFVTRPRQGRKGVHLTFKPSRRLKTHKTGLFSISHFTTSFTCAVSNKPVKGLACSGFGTTRTRLAVHNADIRPNSTGSAVIGTLLITDRFTATLPRRRAPRHADNCRNCCLLADRDKAVSRIGRACCVHSRSQRDFTTHGHFFARRITTFGSRFIRPHVSLALFSRCCGVHSVVRRRPVIISLTIRTCRSYNVAPMFGPVHNKASNYVVSRGNLPAPGLFSKARGNRNGCRFIALRAVTGSISIVVTVIRRDTMLDGAFRLRTSSPWHGPSGVKCGVLDGLRLKEVGYVGRARGMLGRLGGFVLGRIRSCSSISRTIRTFAGLSGRTDTGNRAFMVKRVAGRRGTARRLRGLRFTTSRHRCTTVLRHTLGLSPSGLRTQLFGLSPRSLRFVRRLGGLRALKGTIVRGHNLSSRRSVKGC